MQQITRQGRPRALPTRVSASVLDAVLFGFFVYDGFSLPGLPVAIPVSELASLTLVTIAVLRRADPMLTPARWLFPVFGLMLVFLVSSSIANDVDWFRRGFRIAALVSLLWVVCSGRVNLKAGLTGVAVALMANMGLFYAGIAPDNYGGVLTGYLGDKNVAGLYYVIFPLLIAASSSNRNVRFFSLFFGLLAAFLTESRTSLGAYAAAIAWVLLSARLPRVARAGVGILLIVGLQYVEANLSKVWIFSDREGSDNLRERIGQAAIEKTDGAPWYGLGLGQSSVKMDERLWFFHDSYLGLLAEGGVVFLTVVVGAYLVNGLRPLSSRIRTTEAIYVEAATIALFVCAWKLGEVFLSIPGFILLGYAVKLSLYRRLSDRAEKLANR